MQISCERCGTTYALDDRLIPPGGAPVQCTRCGHVFTAMPPGAAAPPAVLSQPVPAQAHGNRTQMFGIPSGVTGAAQVQPQVRGPAAPAPRVNTQMFGTAPAAPAADPSRSSTQMFGAAPDLSRSSTQMFGAAGARPSGPKSTQMFGGAAPPGAAAPPAALPAPEMPPEPRTAQMFIGRPAPPSPQAAQMSGGASAPPPGEAAEPDRSRTQMFGMAQLPAPEASAPSISTTQMFGAPPTSVLDGAQPSAKRTTTEQQFAAVQPPAAPAQGYEAITAQPPQAMEDPLGFEDTVRRPRPHAPPKPAPPPKSSSLGLDASMATTQMFGAPDEDALEKIWASQAARSGKAGYDRGAPTPLEMPALGGRPGAGLPARDEVPTQGFHGAPTPLETPAARIELPPEPFTVGSDPVAEAVTASDLGADLRKQIRRRNLIALSVVGAVVALLLGVVAVRAGARLLGARGRSVSADALAQRESSRLLVRRDDVVSRQRAVEELTFLTSRYPAYLAAHSDLVVALALQLDDARLVIQQLAAEADELNREIARLQELKVPSDWQNRVNVNIDRVAGIKRQSDPLVDRAAALDVRLSEAYRGLEKLEVLGPEEQQALARAQAVYFGVKGSDQAIALSERYRASGGADGWGDLAHAEYALNTRVPPETVAAAAGNMERLTTSDATFLRPYVLAARLALAQRRYDAAITSLESALALNPAHEVARQLLEWARAREQAESSPAPP